MLKLAQKVDLNRLVSFCRSYPLGTRIECNLTAYGFEREFLKVWMNVDENCIKAVVSSFFGAVTVCAADDADFSEIAEFITMYGCTSVCTESSAAKKMGFENTVDKKMYVFKNTHEFSEVGVCRDEELKSAYDLISSSIPDSFSSDRQAYLSWLSDFTFRRSRSLARIKAVCDCSKVISCAMTAAESEVGAIISGVACNSTQRGKGLGKNTVLTLANELKSENKQVYVIALNDSAGSFYEKIGFEQCSVVSYV